MKIIFLLCTLIPHWMTAQNSNPEKTSQFKCMLTTDRNVYKPGETPVISVAIKNNSPETVYFVNTLDGSESRWRFPYAYFTITRTGDTAYTTRFYGRCGNMNQLLLSDFTEVKPGTSFNPYRQASPPNEKEKEYAYDFRLIDKDNFLLPGHYVINFFYSTMEADFEKWKGRFSGEIKKEEFQKISLLFFKVPKLELHSNELTIEVR